jgi:tripartite-type tricarboxylate transporter receptor subunit TctC
MARLLADKLSKSLGTTVVVENRGGAAGTLATSYVSRSNPDGYTLLFASIAQMSIAPRLQPVDYEPLKSFIPISLLGTNPHILAINASIPAKTLPEFIAYAKAHQGPIRYGSGGQGALAHLAGALFGAENGLRLTHIPYKGGAQTMTALAAGEIQMYLGSASEIISALDSGKVRALAVTTKERLPAFPDLPSLSETNPGFEITSWNGLFAPAGTPSHVVERLAREAAAAAQDPEVVDRLTKLGITPVGNSPSQFTDLIRREQATYEQAVKAAGLAQQ